MKRFQSGWKKHLRVAGTVIALILLIWLLVNQDWELMFSYLNNVSIGIIFFSLFLYIMGQVLNAWRWYVLLKSQDLQITFWTTTKIVFSGAFASNFLPTTIGGDVVRLVNLNRFTNNQGMSLASIVLDRVVNLAAFITVLPFSLTVWLAKPVDPSVTASIALLGFPKLKKWFQNFFAQFIDAYHHWASKPLALIRAFIVSWFSIFVIFLALWILAVAMEIPVSLFQVMGITSMTYLVTLLPLSINGYGLRELAITFFYMRLGATAEQATMLAIISRFLMVFATIPGALWLGEMSDVVRSEEK